MEGVTIFNISKQNAKGTRQIILDHIICLFLIKYSNKLCLRQNQSYIGMEILLVLFYLNWIVVIQVLLSSNVSIVPLAFRFNP